MDTFKFDEKNHTYWLNDKRLTGVTTVLGVINKPALIGWAANMAVDHILENGIESAEQARKAHTKKRDKAATAGTDVHALIEEIINTAIAKNGGYVFHSEDESNEQVKHFTAWSQKHNVKYLESEKKLFDKDLFLAGTADLVCEINGKTYIGDIKTTSGIYDLTPFMQCAAYAHMLTDYKLDGTIIINLKKDNTFDEESDVYYRYDLETDWKGFVHALGLYRVLQTYKKPKKVYEKKT
jgi:hypothetical protein